MIIEAIILKISWHYLTTKMRNNSKTKHGDKKLIISSNKNNNSNSNKMGRIIDWEKNKL